MSFYAYIHRHDHRKPPKTKSGYKGVYEVNLGGNGKPLPRPFKAHIRKHGHYLSLGYYATKEEAARVYNTAAAKLKGEGTYLNPV